MGLMWLLQWPIRAIVLLIVAWLPLGVEVSSFPIALLSAVVIGLLGTLVPAAQLVGSGRAFLPTKAPAAAALGGSSRPRCGLVF